MSSIVFTRKPRFAVCEVCRRLAARFVLCAMLAGRATAFADLSPLTAFRRNAAGGHSTACAVAMVAEPEGTNARHARRRFVAGGAAAVVAGGGVLGPSHAFDLPFGIGKPFQVYEEEGGGLSASEDGDFPIYGSKDIMKKKKHGTSETPVMKNLRWGCNANLADKICNYNRHFAEPAGSFRRTSWLSEVDPNVETTYYDSVTGKPLFIAPRGRTFEQFVKESKVHGWPSFRDEEVVWDNVRCLRDGETVSVTGTHLGHNLPDQSGNRYCINLVSIAGNPMGAN
jgi:peptide methionine sulfoxide reductase MsrB